jgi:hypothetical protein
MNELSTSLPGARGPRRPGALPSLIFLALAACSSSSGGNTGDGAVGQTGGVTGGGGAAGNPGLAGSPGSGSPATDASVPSGGGGMSGGYGGAGGGGTPSTCSDPAFPMSCPARNDVPSICWSAGTLCSTIAKCGDQYFSCITPNTHYDCTEKRCVYDAAGVDGGVECGDPNFPVPCPAVGDVPKLCWTRNTVCSTLVRCGNDFKSCQAAGFRFSCTELKCVPDMGGGGTVDSGAPADAGTAADAGADAAAAAGDAAAADGSSGG